MNQNLVTIIQPIQNQECCVLESVVIDISAVESSNLNNLCGFGDEIITPRVKIKDFVESRFPRIHLVWVNFFIDIKNFFAEIKMSILKFSRRTALPEIVDHMAEKRNLEIGGPTSHYCVAVHYRKLSWYFCTHL